MCISTGVHAHRLKPAVSSLCSRAANLSHWHARLFRIFPIQLVKDEFQLVMSFTIVSVYHETPIRYTVPVVSHLLQELSCLLIQTVFLGNIFDKFLVRSLSFYLSPLKQGKGLQQLVNDIIIIIKGIGRIPLHIRISQSLQGNLGHFSKGI